MSIESQYKGVRHVIRLYWKTYGGFSSLFSSPFFHLAFLVTIACLPIWWVRDWWVNSLSILPSLLGFSIAGFALLLGVGDEGFRRRLGLKRSETKQSTLTNTSASFFHFIAVQIAAIFVAMIASAQPASWIISSFHLMPSPCLGDLLLVIAKLFRFLGFFLLVYALATALAATLSIFRLATIFSEFVSRPPGGAGKSGTSSAGSVPDKPE